LLKEQGKNPLQLDSKELSADIGDYMYNEIRFRSLKDKDPATAELLLNKAREDAKEKYSYYRYLADKS